MDHFVASFVLKLLRALIVPTAKHYTNRLNDGKNENEIEIKIKNEMMRRQHEEMIKETINEIIKGLELKKNEDKGSTILSTLYKMWVAIKNLFRDKKKTAIQLDSELRSLKQGSFSIAYYCKKLKALSDGLSDVGHPVSNETLVIQAITGLNQSSTIINGLLCFAGKAE